MRTVHTLLAGMMATVMAAGNASADVLSDCRSGTTPYARISACTQVLASQSLSAKERSRAYRRRASAFSLLRREQDALADFSEAITLDKTYLHAFVGRGHVHLALKDMKNAITDYSSAIKLNPNYASAHVARGYAYLVDNKVELAVQDFNEAVRLDPKNAVAYNNLALAQRKKGLPNMAIVNFTNAIRQDPLYALAYNNRGYSYEASGLIENAIADYRTAVLIDPSLAGARAALKRLGVSKDIVEETDKLVRTGKKIALEKCSRCHAIEGSKSSPHLRAPPFRVVHQRHPILALREPLKRAIAYPHDEMPKFKLSNPEIDMIIAYINSLEHAR